MVDVHIGRSLLVLRNEIVQIPSLIMNTWSFLQSLILQGHWTLVWVDDSDICQVVNFICP
jgi:hypothetical protein